MIFSIIGLFLDIIGVSFLFFFGILPDKLWKHILMDNGLKDEVERRNKLFSKVGLGLIIVGFCLQTVGLTTSIDNIPETGKGFDQKSKNLGVDLNISTGLRGNLRIKERKVNELLCQIDFTCHKSLSSQMQKIGISLKDVEGFELELLWLDNDKWSTVSVGDSISYNGNFRIEAGSGYRGSRLKDIADWDLLISRVQ